MESATKDTTDTITIQDTEATPDAPASIESGWTSIVPMILILCSILLFTDSSSRKEASQPRNSCFRSKKREEIVTNSGIFGTVTKINDSDNTILVEFAKGVEVKMFKSSIMDIISRRDKGTMVPEKNSDNKQVADKKSTSSKKK
jgi:preprotein translocase subunit YajC